jgi:hypothetical protein
LRRSYAAAPVTCRWSARSTRGAWATRAKNKVIGRGLRRSLRKMMDEDLELYAPAGKAGLADRRGPIRDGRRYVARNIREKTHAKGA